MSHSPRRRFPRYRFCLLVTALALPAASPAIAQQSETSGGSSDQIVADEISPSEQVAPENAPKRMKPDLLVVPIPMSNPTLGTGLTLAAVMFYNPNGSKQPWVTGAGGMYTSNKSWGAAAFHSMSLNQDKFRVLALAGYVDVNINFYGIGANAGDRNISVDLDERGAAVLAQGQYQIAKNLYVGARYQFVNLRSKITRDEPLFPDLGLPQHELDSRLSAIGPAITYDNLDNSFNPHKGMFLTAVGLFNIKDLGSDFSYDKWQFAANAFLPVRRTTTLALHASLCAVSRGGPFYDLCMYGLRNDLRGYETGRYRDRAMWTAQAELRQHLGGKFGAVFFAGVGGIAPSLGNLGDSKFLPSAGMGLRYLASEEAGVNLRLDFAIGRDSEAVYFGIAEAF